MPTQFGSGLCKDRPSEAPRLNFAETPLRKVVRHWAKIQPEKTALIDANRTITYAQLQREIDLVRLSLMQVGIGPGDRIATIIPSSIEFAILLFTAMQLGANLVPIDPLIAQGDVRERITVIKPKLVFADQRAHLQAVSQTGIRTISLDPDENGLENLGDFVASIAAGESTSLGQVSCHAAARTGSDDHAQLPILTIFTSGSTGNPKGVLLSEQCLSHAIAAIDQALNATSEDTFLTALPISHIYGINTGILLPMAVGATAVLVPKFKADIVLNGLEQHRASVFNGVPSMYRRLTREQERRPRDITAMRTGTIAGAQCTNLEDYQRVLHCTARILYGSTETPIVTATRAGDSLDTEDTGVGRFVDTVEARICNDDGTPVAPGEQGEILCKSPGLMLGYLDDPKAIRACVDDDGWMHMGDIAYEDERGYVHIVGRKSDIINRGGYKISPAEVERIYAEHPALTACCAMGLPHDELGQQIVLFVEAREAQASASELRDFAKQRLAKFKIPDQVIFVDAMPYLPNGKLDKRALAQQFERDETAFHNDAELRQRLAKEQQ